MYDRTAPSQETTAGVTKFVAPPVREIQTEKGMIAKFSAGGVEMSLPLYGDPFERKVIELARDGEVSAFFAAVLKYPDLYNTHVRGSGSGHH